MAKEMETDGNLEKLGVEAHRVKLWIRIKILKPDLVKRSMNLKLDGVVESWVCVKSQVTRIL